MRIPTVAGIASAVVVLGFSVVLAHGAAERDLFAGLAYLRAGAQAEAAIHLKRYLDEERDADVRRSVARALPLLSHPLSEDVREYIAAGIEDSVRAKPKVRAEARSQGYLSRIFPVFP
jgi:hypothetical protein